MTSTDAQDRKEQKVAVPDSSQAKRARELIYLFRQFRMRSRDDQWAQTVRELIEIGEPAVPELVAELDRTERRDTIQSLCFTLRAIGDPRAVPALIRALPKTHVNDPSGGGVWIRDPKLRELMRKHQYDIEQDEPQWVLRGSPIWEVTSSLEKLTGHSMPLQLKGVDDRQHRWLAWWKDHEDEYPLDEELLVVADRNPDDDLVNVAGSARYGPLFPTGPDWRLGPVREVTLGSSLYANAKSYLDLDSGRRFEIFQGSQQRERPANLSNIGAFLNWKSEMDRQWRADQGIDLENHFGFAACDMDTWVIDDSRWETIDDEIRSKDPLELGPEINIHSELSAMLPDDVKEDDCGTFLFLTREGGRGILRITAEIGQNLSRHLQYRLFESIDQSSPELPAEPAVIDKTRFNKTITVTLPIASSDAECMLDLETERQYSLPAEFKTRLSNLEPVFHEQESDDWCGERGIDLFAARDKQRHPDHPLMVVYRKMRVIRVLPKTFYQLTIEEVQELLRRDPHFGISGKMANVPEKIGEFESYVFQTVDGTVGLVKLEQIPDEPDKIMIRYRMDQSKRQSD